MAQTKAKRKGGEKPRAIYKGALGRRSNDLPPLPPANTVIGVPPSEASKSKHQQEIATWALRQATRALEGVPLLFAHYGIEATRDNYPLLVLAIARDHVPYFMPPTRGRGRPGTTKPLLPVVDALAKGLDVPERRVFELFADEVLHVDVDSVARDVKRYRVAKKKAVIPT